MLTLFQLRCGWRWSYVQTRKRNNYLCINCICTRVHNVSKFLSCLLSFSLSVKLQPCRIVASPHRRARPSYLRNRSRSLACVQTECIPVYTAECMQSRDRSAFTCNQALCIPVEKLTYRVLQRCIFCSDRAFPSTLYALNEPHAAHLDVSTIAKRTSINFCIARTFFCFNKKLNVFYFSFTTSHWED